MVMMVEVVVDSLLVYALNDDDNVWFCSCTIARCYLLVLLLLFVWNDGLHQAEIITQAMIMIF